MNGAVIPYDASLHREGQLSAQVRVIAMVLDFGSASKPVSITTLVHEGGGSNSVSRQTKERRIAAISFVATRNSFGPRTDGEGDSPETIASGIGSRTAANMMGRVLPGHKLAYWQASQTLWQTAPRTARRYIHPSQVTSSLSEFQAIRLPGHRAANSVPLLSPRSLMRTADGPPTTGSRPDNSQ
jgi:hypothetical protein